MKAFCALLAAVPVWPCLAEECSDTVGSCAAKSASLMQFKSLSQKKQALSLETHSGFSSKLAGFQKFTDEMIQKYGQAPATDFGDDITYENPDDDNSGAATGRSNSTSTNEVSKDVRLAVRKVLDFIDSMANELERFHEMDLEKARKCSDVVGPCKDVHMNHDISTEILRAKGDATAAEVAHRTCRVEAAPGKCEPVCAIDGPCQLYDYARDARNYNGKDLVDPEKPNEEQIRSIPDCVADDAFNDANIKAPEDSDGLQTMEQCLVDSNAWLDYLFPKYEDCRTQEGNCENEVVDCDDLQKDFQESQCLFATESNLHCSQLNQCIDDKTEECQTDCETILMRAGARAADNETGQRLVCLLHALFGAPDTSKPDEDAAFLPRPDAASIPKALAHCKDANIDTSDWEILCPSTDSGATISPSIPQVEYICPVAPDRVLAPCEDGFVEHFYLAHGMQTALPSTGDTCSEQARRGQMKVVHDCAAASAECLALAI